MRLHVSGSVVLVAASVSDVTAVTEPVARTGDLPEKRLDGSDSRESGRSSELECIKMRQKHLDLCLERVQRCWRRRSAQESTGKSQSLG